MINLLNYTQSIRVAIITVIVALSAIQGAATHAGHKDQKQKNQRDNYTRPMTVDTINWVGEKAAKWKKGGQRRDGISLSYGKKRKTNQKKSIYILIVDGSMIVYTKAVVGCNNAYGDNTTGGTFIGSDRRHNDRKGGVTIAETLGTLITVADVSAALQKSIDVLNAQDPSAVENVLMQIQHEAYSNIGSDAVKIPYSNISVLTERLIASNLKARDKHAWLSKTTREKRKTRA